MRQVKEYIYVQKADKMDTFIKRFNPILERESLNISLEWEKYSVY